MNEQGAPDGHPLFVHISCLGALSELRGEKNLFSISAP